jgi:hypothetical protein
MVNITLFSNLSIIELPVHEPSETTHSKDSNHNPALHNNQVVANTSTAPYIIYNKFIFADFNSSSESGAQIKNLIPANTKKRKNIATAIFLMSVHN